MRIPSGPQLSRGDETGIHTGLKILGLTACGFESHPRHKRAKRVWAEGESQLLGFRWDEKAGALPSERKGERGREARPGAEEAEADESAGESHPRHQSTY